MLFSLLLVASPSQFLKTGKCPSQCFPNDAALTIKFEDGSIGTRRMDELRVGDNVLSASGFSRVFAFMDHAANADGAFVTLRTVNGSSLSMTADHIIWAGSPMAPINAATIKAGDTLWLASPSATSASPVLVPSVVADIDWQAKEGLHAPLTADGSVVVNGVLTSSYAKVRSLYWGNRALVSGHVLNKMMHAPLRWACEIRESLCDPEMHLPDSGRHVWTQAILDKLGWLQEANAVHPDLSEALFGANACAASRIAAVAQLGVTALLGIAYLALFALHPSVTLAGAAVGTSSLVARACCKARCSKW